MPFRPNINDIVTIDGAAYRIAEHPSAPGMPYGQTGRRATVYQLRAGDTVRALKVFTPAFRTPRTVESAQRLASFAALPGLQAASRTVLTSHGHAPLLSQHPDLEYAVLMPWILGETWQEVVLSRRPLSVETCYALARDLARVLATMEQHRIAHCDLAGPNLILTTSPVHVALVDLEEIYAPGLPQPDKLPGGSPGYAHRTAPSGLWSPVADRFSGAVLLAEILGWCDERVRTVTGDEQFFDPEEVHQPSMRYQLLVEVLRKHWGEGLATAFTDAWNSSSLDACPPLAGWAELLAVTLTVSPLTNPGSPQERLAHATLARAEALIELGRTAEALNEFSEAHKLAPEVAAAPYARALLSHGATYETTGDIAAALTAYERAMQVAPAGALRNEIALIIAAARAKLTPEIGKCPNCKQSIQPSWVRCPYCGAALPQTDVAATIPSGTAPFPVMVDRPRWRAPMWVLAVLSLVLLLVGASVVTYAAMRPNATLPIPPTAVIAAVDPTLLLPTLLPSTATLNVVPSSTSQPPTATPVPPTATPVPPTATLIPQLRDVPISLAPFANDNIRNILPKIPLGMVSFGNIQFDLGDGTSKVSTECSTYPNWPSQVSIPVSGLTGVERVRLLANAGYTVGFNGQKIGEVDLLFNNGSLFTYDLVLGDNIREWRIEVPDTVATIKSKDSAVVYEGQSIKEDKGVIDMISITVPFDLRVLPLTSIVVRDTMPGNPCFFFSGLTVQAR